MNAQQLTQDLERRIRESGSKSLEAFTEAILHYMCENIQATRGVFYTIDDEGNKLDAMATYGILNSQMQQATFRAGDGLIGQTIVDKRLRYFGDLEPGQLSAPAGSGCIAADATALIPLCFSDKLFGLIQIETVGSWFGKAVIEQEFMNTASNIAASLQGMLNNRRMETLLHDSQQQAEEIRAREEEMRQNLEELETTQEQIERLKDELDRQQQAIDRSTGMAEFDLEGYFLRVNKVLADALGYTPEEVVGQHHRMVVDPEYAESEAYAQFWNNLRKGEIHAEAVPRVGKDGQPRWLQATYNPIFDNAGRVTKILKLAQDITAQRLLQQQQSDDQNALYVSLLEVSVDPIVCIDGHGIIQLFNRAAQELFGYGEQEAVGQNINIMMPSPHHENHDGYLALYLETGEKNIIGKGRNVEAVTKSGEKIPVYLAVSRAETNGEVLFMGILRDLRQNEHSSNNGQGMAKEAS